MAQAAMQPMRTVPEYGYKIIHGKEDRFTVFNDAPPALTVSQDSFESTCGGDIPDCAWRYAGVRYGSGRQKNAWHNHPRRQASSRTYGSIARIGALASETLTAFLAVKPGLAITCARTSSSGNGRWEAIAR